MTETKTPRLDTVIEKLKAIKSKGIGADPDLVKDKPMFAVRSGKTKKGKK